MMKNFDLTNKMKSPMLKQKGHSGWFRATFLLLLLLPAFIWQCEKDDFEGETIGICPEVISTDPANGATNVVTHKIITATFNVAMNPASVNAQTFTIKQGTIMVPGVVTYADKVATFTPTKPLEANKTYTGMMSKKVKDPEGNYPIEDYIWSFSTGNVPTVILTDPATAASNVPLNKIITATFSTVMDNSTINTATFLVNQGTNPIAGTVTYAGITATFTPSSPLVDNMVYTGTITIGAKDVAGNAMATHYKWSFSTAQTQYIISLSSNPVEGGSTSGGGMFNKDDQVTVTATPVPGYTFTNWTEGTTIVSTNANYAFTATSNRTLVANFTINTFTLTVNATNGSVTKVPNQTIFNYGTSVLLTAVPNAGYSFTGWSGDATGTSNSLTIVMNSNKNITANFALTPPNTYTLNVTSTLGGSAAKNPSLTGYNSGAVVQVTATPNTGYTFAGWSGDASGTTNPLSVTMNSDKNIIANFTLIPPTQFTVSLSSNPIIGGNTSGGGTFNSGASVTVTAVANSGYLFTNWTEGINVVSTNAMYNFTISGNKTLVANFALIAPTQYSVSLASNPAIGGNTSGGGTFNSGASVTVIAVPNTGYSFTNWTEGINVVSSNAMYNFTISGNRTLVANFASIAPTQYTVSLSSNPIIGGSTSGGGSFNSGASVTVSAVPAVGYAFTNWTEGINIVSPNVNYTIANLQGNRILVANFELIPPSNFTLNVTAINGSVNKNPNSPSYLAGATVQLTATPNTGYTFTSWGGDATGTNNPLTVLMDADKEIVANFSIITYTLTVISVNGTVVKNPEQIEYNYGENVELTATPNSGYAFDSWSGDATGSTNPITVLMDRNKTVTANYTVVAPLGPGKVNLGTAGNFAILTKSGISTTGTTLITGDIGVSPIDHTAITGFSETLDPSGEFSTSIYVVGNIYATDYAVPTPTYTSTAISDQETAFTTAMGLTLSVINDLGAGDISGMTLAPGLYKWGTGLLITNAGVTLAGGPNDTWVFQIADDFTINNDAIITLTGGAKPENIFWVTSTQALLGSNVDFSGIILAQTLISLNSGTTVHGRLLAQTEVTLISSTVTEP